jgi:hypothetical protein
MAPPILPAPMILIFIRLSLKGSGAERLSGGLAGHPTKASRKEAACARLRESGGNSLMTCVRLRL